MNPDIGCWKKGCREERECLIFYFPGKNRSENKELDNDVSPFFEGKED
jgi:hypothetical protein